MTRSLNDIQHQEHQYQAFIVIMLHIVMLNVVMLNIVMLSVIVLNIVMLSVARCIVLRAKVVAPVSERIQDPPKSISFLIDSLFILLI